MSFDAAHLAQLKHAETSIDSSDWLRALESAQLSLKTLAIDQAHLEKIALASRTPEKFTIVIRLMYQYGKSYPNGQHISVMFTEYVSASPFSLADWIDAIEYFHNWLVKHTRKIDFLPMLKYLECCAVSTDAKETGQTMLSLLTDMLHVFGYEAG